MRRALLAAMLCLAAPAAAQAAPPNLGPTPWKCGGGVFAPYTSGCYGADTGDPAAMDDTGVGDLTVSPHVVRTGENITVTAQGLDGWTPTIDSRPAGTVVSGCGPSDTVCTVKTTGSTGSSWARASGHFSSFATGVEQDYYAVIGEGRVISGTVKNRDPRQTSQLVAAVGVEVVASIDGKVFRTTTNRNGVYQLLTDAGSGTVATSRRHCVKSQLPARCVTSRSLTLPPDATVDFEAPPTHKVSGIIKQQFSDKPAKGVAIRADSAAGGDRLASATSGADGRYELTVRAGNVHLTSDDQHTCAIAGSDCPESRDLNVQADTTQDWRKKMTCEVPDEVSPSSASGALRAASFRAAGDVNAAAEGSDAEKQDCPIFVNRKTDEEDKDLADGRCDVDLATDEDECTLRAAIQEVNARSKLQPINFRIKGDGVPVIKPQKALPAINRTTTVDGTTQGGAAGEPAVEIDGSEAGGNVDGLRVSAGGTIVKGLIIVRFRGQGIVFDAGSGSSVQGCWIGVHRGGTGFEAAGNGAGVEVKAPKTVVQGNVLSGSGNAAKVQDAVNQLKGAKSAAPSQLAGLIGAVGIGAFVTSDNAAGSTISRNIVGLAPDGTRTGSLADPTGAFGNTFGIAVLPLSGGKVTGLSISDNVVSGDFAGIVAASAGVKVSGNKIGPGTDGKPVKPGLFGNGIGLLAIGQGDPMDVSGNVIQGNNLGVLFAGKGLNLANNQIGVNQNLVGFGQDLAAALSAGEGPSLGLHNIVGVLLVGIGAQVTGNQILGNPMGLMALGVDNVISRNVIGGSEIAPKPIQKLKARDMTGIIGTILAGKRNRFDANKLSGNIFGAMSFFSDGGSFTGNAFSTNILGLITFNTTGTTFSGNAITGGAIGLMSVQHEFTAAELKAAGLADSDVQAKERMAIVNAPATQRELEIGSGLGGEKIDSSDVRFGTAAARAARPRATQGSVKNVFTGNFIGTADEAGSVRAGNVFGAWLAGGQRDVRFEDNTIAHNVVTGLLLGPGIAGDWPTDVRLRGNRIYDNHQPGLPLRGLGFDLLELNALARSANDIFGPSPPDVGDVDDGPNGLQNAPVLAAAAPDGKSTRVVGTLNSLPNTSYTVELFANGRCGPFGFGEGEVPLGRVTLKTGADGNAPFSGKVTLPAGHATAVTAMATGPDGTSEFSNCQRTDDEPVAAAPGPLTPDGQGRVPLTVFCLDADGCQGTATLDGPGPGNRSAGGAEAAAAKRVRLGRRSFRVKQGKRAEVRLKLSRAAIKRLKASKRMTVVATVRLRDGRSDTVSWTLRPLKKPKKTKKKG